MDDAELHRWAARLENQIRRFRLLNPDGLVLGGFGSVKTGGRDVRERISNMQKALAKFTITGGDGVSVEGSIQTGYAISATSVAVDSSDAGGTGATGPITGCTDPAANNFNPFATVDDGSCTYDSVCSDLSFGTTAPDCGTEYFVGTFTNPFGVSVTMTISYHVDDDLIVDGVVVDDGAFPFTDTGPDPCPGSGFLNGEHSGTYIITVSASQTVSVSVRNNFRGSATLSGTICFG